MTNEELLTPGPSSNGGSCREPGLSAPSDSQGQLPPDGYNHQDSAQAEDTGFRKRLVLTRLPDGSGYTCVGRNFTFTVSADLDVEFEFDSDLTPSALEASELRAGLIALVLLVRNISVRLGAREEKGPSSDGRGPHAP